MENAKISVYVLFIKTMPSLCNELFHIFWRANFDERPLVERPLAITITIQKIVDKTIHFDKIQSA